jgi:hypothetical protein
MIQCPYCANPDRDESQNCVWVEDKRISIGADAPCRVDHYGTMNHWFIQPSYRPDDNVLPGCIYAFSIILMWLIAANILIYGSMWLLGLI